MMSAKGSRVKSRSIPLTAGRQTPRLPLGPLPGPLAHHPRSLSGANERIARASRPRLPVQDVRLFEGILFVLSSPSGQ